MKRALITGATGYIGSNLVRLLLAEGIQLAVISRYVEHYLPKEAERFIYDGSSASMLYACKTFKPDIVFHLASMNRTVTPAVEISNTDIPDLIAANLTFGTQLLDAMYRNGCNYLINTGSYWQYDQYGHVDPSGLYAVCKQAFENIIDYYVKRHGLSALSLVLFDVYGPRDPRRKFLNEVISSTLEQRPMKATPGEQLVEFVHVDDICRGFLTAAKWLPMQATTHHFRFGLNSKRRDTLKNIAMQVERVSQKTLQVEWGGLPYPPHQIFTPVTNMPRLPDWEPLIDLPQGIAELCSAYHDRP